MESLAEECSDLVRWPPRPRGREEEVELRFRSEHGDPDWKGESLVPGADREEPLKKTKSKTPHLLLRATLDRTQRQGVTQVFQV